MTELPRPKLSPRNVNGVLKFYEGDTFSYCLYIELSDQDGVPVILDPALAEIKVRFYDRRKQLIKEFAFGGTDGGEINENRITLDFDSETTALFKKGRYTYDCVLESGETRVTLLDGALLTVE